MFCLRMGVSGGLFLMPEMDLGMVVEKDMGWMGLGMGMGMK